MPHYKVMVEVDVDDFDGVGDPYLAAQVGWERISELEAPVVEVRLVGDAEPGDGLLLELQPDGVSWQEYAS
jgi:hypothetical protein